ncbi:MAG: hypothetical protein ACH350_00340 [Parachlamydiaceae bacterium]
MSRLPLWQTNWDEAELAWDRQACESARSFPLRGLKNLPQMPGITEETAKGLKWKSLKWMILKDHRKEILRGFLKHPLKYGWAFLKSVWRTKPYKRQGDFFLYGVDSLSRFEELLKDRNALLILGFSYCHKPFECPSGRFTPDCIRERGHPVCQQCFIGKAAHAGAHDQTIPLFIPTIHYIGGKIFEIAHQHRGRPLLFMITACEMTLEMFGDWGNMVNIRGVGIRLDGRICNTMKAFELSERGIKPGLTVVLDQTQNTMLKFIRSRHEAFLGI